MFTRKYILSLGKLSLCIVTGEIIVNCLIVATLSIDSDRINIGQDFNRCVKVVFSCILLSKSSAGSKKTHDEPNYSDTHNKWITFI